MQVCVYAPESEPLAPLWADPYIKNSLETGRELVRSPQLRASNGIALKH